MIRNKTMVFVSTDFENNAELFWSNVREQLPAIAAKLDATDEAVELTAEEWSAVQAIDGFADGPEYARTALIEVEA